VESTRIQNGVTEPIEVTITDASGTPQTGLIDVLLDIRRISDGFFLDFNDLIFKGGGWTTIQLNMTERDSINAPGVYYYNFVTTGYSDDTYEMRASSITAGPDIYEKELKVGGFVDNIDAPISTIDSNINIITGIVTDTRNIVKNKLTIDETNSKLQVWDVAGTTVLYEWDLTDKDGNVIVLQGTGPANRGVVITP
jgi:hypothetical protein